MAPSSLLAPASVAALSSCRSGEEVSVSLRRRAQPRRPSSGCSLRNRILLRKLVMRVSASTGSPPSNDPILLIGVTGGTGFSAVQGFLSANVEPSRLSIMTRDASKPQPQALARMGCRLVEADLDDESSLKVALQGARKVERGLRLARAGRDAGVEHLVYNSAGGVGRNSGVAQIDQKGAVEAALRDHGVPSTMLRAALFMEEFWKKYTRPSILKGSFPFALPLDTKLQLVSVRDMGRVAAMVLARKDNKYINQAFELAGDELSIQQICEAFSRAQGYPVTHKQVPAWLVWLIKRELYHIVRFYRDEGYKADVARCRSEFEGLLTFEDFLQATRWADQARTWDAGVRYAMN
eukprot:jgi/Chlat1/7001/Chrsp56S06694